MFYLLSFFFMHQKIYFVPTLLGTIDMIIINTTDIPCAHGAYNLQEESDVHTHSTTNSLL